MSGTVQKTRLILASASPRRRELLSSLGLSFEVLAAELEERPAPGEAPERYVERVACEKAAKVASLRGGALVLAADTEVVVDGEVLGKPRDPAHAVAMLRRLSGRCHRVLTAVALDGVHRARRVVETKVCFRPLGEQEIAWYVGTGEPLDKAGAYALQGKGGALVQSIEGSASGVIGLPLAETVEMLVQAAFALPWSEGCR